MKNLFIYSFIVLVLIGCTTNGKNNDEASTNANMEVAKKEDDTKQVLNGISEGKQSTTNLTNKELSLQQIISKLQKGQRTFYMEDNEIQSLSEREIVHMKAALEGVWYTEEINDDNKAKLIDEGYAYGVLQYDFENGEYVERDDWYFFRIPEDLLNEQLFKHFDTTVSPNEVPSSPPVQSNIYDENGNFIYEPVTFYEDGYYYYTAAEFPGSLDIPICELTHVTPLKDSYYYVEYKNFTFNSMDYPGNFYDEDFLHLPLQHWPQNAIDLLFEDEARKPGGVAILKKNLDESYAVRYLTENHLITDEHIDNLQ